MVITAAPPQIRLHLNTALRNDPARIRGLQNRLIKQVKGRFAVLQTDIKNSIVTQDCFGIQIPTLLAGTGLEPYRFEKLPAKIDGFMDWLRAQQAAGILDIHVDLTRGLTAIPGWSGVYVDSYYMKSLRDAYQKGIDHAQGVMTSAGFIPTVRPINYAFQVPIHAEKIGMIYSRAYEDLKSVMETANGSIRRELAQGLSTGLARGLAEGRSPRDIARQLYKDVENRLDTIGQTRLLMIARTETARAMHVANIEEYRAAGLDGVTVQAEWLTSGLDNVCPECEDLEGKTFALDEIEDMIPLHPNCACVAMPVLPGEGEAEAATTGDEEARPPEEEGAPPEEEAALEPIEVKADDWTGTSLSDHILESGGLSPEREAMHESIVRSLFAETRPVSPSGVRTYQMTGGGSAAGKGTLLDDGVIVIPKGGAIIDADAIKAMLPEYKALLKAGDIERAAAFVHRESSLISERAIAYGLDRRIPITLDGTGDGTLEKLLKRLSIPRKAGYQVTADYVTIDIETAISRATVRAIQTGRKVPKEVIRTSHQSVAKILPDAIKQGAFDSIRVWDNTLAKPIMIAEGKGSNLVIHNQQLWDAFVRRGGERIGPRVVGSAEELLKSTAIKETTEKAIQREMEKLATQLDELWNMPRNTEIERAAYGERAVFLEKRFSMAQQEQLRLREEIVGAREMLLEAKPVSKIAITGTMEGHSTVREAQEFLHRLIAPETSPAFTAEAFPVRIDARGVRRAKAFNVKIQWEGQSKSGAWIWASRKTPTGTIVHEMGHALEFSSEKIRLAVAEFIERRRAGEALKSLRVLTGFRYRSSELAFKDRWIHPYIGKYYKDGSTEFVSMGLQMLYEDAVAFARQDPEMFDLILRIAKGQL